MYLLLCGTRVSLELLPSTGIFAYNSSGICLAIVLIPGVPLSEYHLVWVCSGKPKFYLSEYVFILCSVLKDEVLLSREFMIDSYISQYFKILNIILDSLVVEESTVCLIVIFRGSLLGGGSLPLLRYFIFW